MTFIENSPVVWLQSDGYEAYPAYVRAHPGVVWLGLWLVALVPTRDSISFT